jgi:hypothetical protein
MATDASFKPSGYPEQAAHDAALQRSWAEAQRNEHRAAVDRGDKEAATAIAVDFQRRFGRNITENDAPARPDGRVTR